MIVRNKQTSCLDSTGFPYVDSHLVVDRRKCIGEKEQVYEVMCTNASKWSESGLKDQYNRFRCLFHCIYRKIHQNGLVSDLEGSSRILKDNHHLWISSSFA